MRKIVCFTDSLGLGGAQRQLVGLATLLKNKGYDVTVLLYHNIPFYKQILDDCGIESVVISGGYITRILRLYKYLRNCEIDVIIAYQSMPSLIACLLRSFIDCKKLIVSERSTSEKITFKKRILFRLWKYADYIVPNSYSQESFIRNTVPQYSDKLTVITNFIDTKVYVPKSSAPINENTLTLLTLARVTPIKNILEYIRAIHIVRQQGYEVSALWYGDTDCVEYQQQCHSLISKYNLSSSFIMRPAQNDVVSLYHAADVLCLPSLSEGCPNVICEAMGCGMPILCSDVCDNPRIVEDGENAILFRTDCAERIAEAIIQYIHLPLYKKQQMGIRSRELALLRFSSDVFIRKYINLIEN